MSEDPSRRLWGWDKRPTWLERGSKALPTQPLRGEAAGVGKAPIRHNYSFVGYYWVFTKHFGRRLLDTKGGEFLSILALTVTTVLVSYIVGEHDSTKALIIGIFSLLGWLSIFAIVHLIRTPVLLHGDAETESRARSEHWRFGVLGITILVVIAASSGLLVWWWYAGHERTVVFSIANPGGLAIGEIVKENRELKSELTPFTEKEPEDSLRKRTMKLADELSDFWAKNPPPPYPGNPGPTQDVKKKEIFDDYWRRVDNVYALRYKDRVLGVIRAYSGRGVPTGFLEAAAENHTFGASAFSSSGMRPPDCRQDEVCELRELAYHVDARGNAIELDF